MILLFFIYKRQKFVYDVVILHSAQEKFPVHPSQIKQDLEKSESVHCWCADRPDQVAVDTMSLLIRNARLVIVCMSDSFANDQRCCELFAYVKQLFDANRYMLVALGQSFEWQKSQVGALITHELFVKINKVERFIFWFLFFSIFSNY